MARGRIDEVVYSFAMTLDGFIARADGRFDFLDGFPADADFDFDSFMASLGGIVMARGTYDVVRRHDEWVYGKWPTLVATNRPLADAPDGVEALSGTPQDLLDRLAAMGGVGRVWLLGGGDLARQFLDAGLLDIVEIGIIPVVLGAGIPAFGVAQTDRWLDLEFAKPLKNGAIHCRYRVRRAATA